MPSEARPELLTFPVAISWPAMLVTVSLGIANPIPAAAPLFTLITARSSGANTPTTSPASGLPPLAGLTCSVVAVPTTWALVTMSPSVS